MVVVYVPFVDSPTPHEDLLDPRVLQTFFSALVFHTAYVHPELIHGFSSRIPANSQMVLFDPIVLGSCGLFL